MSAIHSKVAAEGRLPAPLEDERGGVTRRRVICPDCQRERKVYADKNVLTCRACANKAKRNGEMVECPGCQTMTYMQKGYVERGIRYCSIACFNENYKRKPPSEATRQKLSESKMGKRNPNYKNGKKAGTSIRGFSLAEKGEKACRVCGDEVNVHAHHAIPRSLSPLGRADLRNCLPLCASHHMGWHRGNPITRDNFTEAEWSFIQTLIGPGWLDKRYPPPKETP